MKKTWIIIAVFLLLAVLHQDVWNWDNPALVWGFIPIGLFYHACYSLVAAGFWALVVKFAWPTKLEEWAEGNDEL
ncbi:MAG: hypothetical protein OSA93_01140 [Akkermansiaceae bacterium]|jgi:uncharacterized membrane protein|nr:hypothetical protein [Akkermansiaceae bacterium]